MGTPRNQRNAHLCGYEVSYGQAVQIAGGRGALKAIFGHGNRNIAKGEVSILRSGRTLLLHSHR